MLAMMGKTKHTNCKVDFKVGGNVEIENMMISSIIEEYYDPNGPVLNEEDLEAILVEFGESTPQVIKFIDIDEVLLEYYDPDVIPLTPEELEEILIEYSDEALIVDMLDVANNNTEVATDVANVIEEYDGVNDDDVENNNIVEDNNLSKKKRFRNRNYFSSKHI